MGPWEEPDWPQVRARLGSLTVRELRGLGRRWFSGSLGGASTKADICDAMASQMRSWWRQGAGSGARVRTESALGSLAAIEGRRGGC